ncbi:MAG: BPL-N domain-containing protein [Acidobacteriota bacterium]
MKNILLLISIYLFFILNIHSIENKSFKTNDIQPIKVGVYGDFGASVICVMETMASLRIDSGIKSKVIFGSDIAEGILDHLDVIVFPGGSGSKESSSMGAQSRKKVREFVLKDGKGCVGICAGGYLLSSTPVYKWSLKLTSSSVYDRAHYNRGRGLIELSLTEAGEKFFPELIEFKSFFLQYYDGPVLVRLESSELPEYENLGKYVTDIHLSGGSMPGVTPGKTALLLNKAGKGKVFVVTGHPESTPGMRWMVPRMVRVVADRKLISYPKTVVRPERESKPILFNKKRIKREKTLFWKLVGDSKNEKINSLKELIEMRSRPGLRWAIGLLRDNSPEVRSFAAKVLAEAEYTPSIKDLKIAEKTEKDPDCLKELKKSLSHLSGIIKKNN